MSIEIYLALNLIFSTWLEEAISFRRVREIVKAFRDGDRENFDRVRGSGRPTSQLRKDSVDVVREAVATDNCSSILSIILILSPAMVSRILVDKLEKIWFKTQWVPHVLTEYHRRQRVTCCTDMLVSFQSCLAVSNLIIKREMVLLQKITSPKYTWIIEFS